MEVLGKVLTAEAKPSWSGRTAAFESRQPGESRAIIGGDRFSPPGSGPVAPDNGDPLSAGGIFASFMNFTKSIFGELAQLMQQLIGQSGAAPQPSGSQTYYKNASLGSVGDPHESFSGTGDGGQAVHGTWDSMSSHDHLITSDSVPGGYNVATSVTAPSSNGVTYNANATITTNDGNTVVTMGKDGSPTVVDNGQQVSLTAGTPVTLSNGESVTLNKDGSLKVSVSSGQGGTIDTTLKSNGSGVDVTATANNVDLGGYLASKQDAPSSPTANPATAAYQPYQPAIAYQPYQPYAAYQPYLASGFSSPPSQPSPFAQPYSGLATGDGEEFPVEA